MRTTAEETKRNNQRILDAAIRVFSEKGYEAASMQDIADAAGISRGPLYYRYKTKKDIYLAALEVHADREWKAQSRLLHQDLPLAQRLRNFLWFSTRNLREGAPEFPMDISSAPDMQDVNERIRTTYAAVDNLMMEEISRAVDRGELKDDTDVKHLVNLLFIVYDGLKVSRLKSGILASPETVGEAVDHICTLVQARYGNS